MGQELSSVAFHFLEGGKSFDRLPQTSLMVLCPELVHIPHTHPKLIINLTNHYSFPEAGQMSIQPKLHFCHRIST